VRPRGHRRGRRHADPERGHAEGVLDRVFGSGYYSNVWDYYGYGWATVYPIGEARKETTIVVETLLFDVASEKPIWAGVSGHESEERRHLHEDLTRNIVKELQKEDWPERGRGSPQSRSGCRKGRRPADRPGGMQPREGSRQVNEPESVNGRPDVEERDRFQALLLELSTRFINLEPGDVDREIEDALRRVCELLGIDFALLWQWTPGPQGVVSPTHTYPPGGPAASRPPAAGHYPGSCSSAGRPVVALSRLDELPAEAAIDRENARRTASDPT